MGFWGVVRSEPAREAIATRFLQAAGYPAYHPKILIPPAGRNRGKIASLFPQYVFVLLHDQWSAARWSPGVNSLLMNDGAPARIADSVVEAIKAREDPADGLIRLTMPHNGFRPGDAVRITSGAFEHMIGVYATMTGNERSQVLLAMLGRSVRIQLPTHNLEALMPVGRSR
jgi:transcriptional antiterminator RfaH